MNTDPIPSAFFDKPIPTEDVCQFIFRQENKPLFGFFTRKTVMFLAPIVVMRSGMIYVIVGCEIKGIFQKEALLRIKNDRGEVIGIKIPYSMIERDDLEAAKNFFGFIMQSQELLIHMVFPDYIFQKTLQLNENGA